MVDRDRIFCDESDRVIYDQIFNDLFPKLSRREQFLFAMAYGAKNNSKIELKKRDGFFNLKDIKNKEDTSVMIALAMWDLKNLEVITDMEKVYSIAEEYARAGIILLKDLRDKTPHGDFIKVIESILKNDIKHN